MLPILKERGKGWLFSSRHVWTLPHLTAKPENTQVVETVLHTSVDTLGTRPENLKEEREILWKKTSLPPNTLQLLWGQEIGGKVLNQLKKLVREIASLQLLL